MAELNKGNASGQPNQGTQNPQNTSGGGSGGNMSDEDRRRQAGGAGTQSQGDKNVAGRTDAPGRQSNQPDKTEGQEDQQGGMPDKNRPGQPGR
jgi:hypothetical protein